MLVDVVMPKMGESIQEGKILRWMKKPGEKIAQDESILEISTDKVDSEIPSPAAGFLSKIIVPEGETVDVGTVIAVIETDAVSVAIGLPATVSPADSKSSAGSSVAASPRAETFEGPMKKETKPGGGRFYSPLVRAIARKEGVALEELDHLDGSGIAGRLT